MKEKTPGMLRRRLGQSTELPNTPRALLDYYGAWRAMDYFIFFFIPYGRSLAETLCYMRKESRGSVVTARDAWEFSLADASVCQMYLLPLGVLAWVSTHMFPGISSWGGGGTFYSAAFLLNTPLLTAMMIALIEALSVQAVQVLRGKDCNFRLMSHRWYLVVHVVATVSFYIFLVWSIDKNM